MSVAQHVITGVQISVWSASDIEKQAALDLSETNGRINLTMLINNRFGSTDSRTMCYECRQNGQTCSGHWGMIRLGCALPNPLFLKDIRSLLQCFCRKCSTLLYDKKRMELNDMLQLPGEERIRKVCDILTKTKGIFHCPNQKCKLPVDEIIIQDDKNFFVRYPEEGKKKKKLQLEYEEIYAMFKNISNEDLVSLGFNENLIDNPIYKNPATFTHSMMEHRHQNRPEDYFITILPVLPLAIRPCIAMGKDIKHDGSTILYQLILKAVKAFKEAKNDEVASSAKEIIQKHIFALYKQKNDDTNKKSFNSMWNRLSGKNGHFRASVEAKRANHGGRTVVGNAPYLPFGGVELPQEMAKISQIEYVFAGNLDYWNKILYNDKRLYKLAEDNYDHLKKMPRQPVYLTKKPFIFYDPIVQYVLRDNKKTSFKFIDRLEIGDIVHRKLRTGDVAIINRQPTIRKENFNAHRIFICPNPEKRTLGIPLPCCQSYNMD